MSDRWKLISEELVYNGYRKILKRRYELPSGLQNDFDIVSGRDSVAVLAITPDKKVILARQFRPGPQQQFNEMPGGMVDAGESPLDAGVRELLEETGYAGDALHLGEAWHGGYSTGMRQVVVVTNCKKVQEVAHEPTEDIEVVLMDMQDFKEQAYRGELTDGFGAFRGLAYLGELESGR